MSDLFKKLNTLVKSTVNDALSNVPSVPNPMNRRLDKDVEALRQRINEAIDHETTLQEKVKALQDEVALLDQQADEALQQGNDALARHILEKMQRSQQRLAMAESDLREHQIVAQELIQRVNLLDAIIADVRREQQEQQQAEQTETQSPQNSLREKIAGISEQLTIKPEAPVSDAPVDEQAIDDDLEVRRNRLSKR